MRHKNSGRKFGRNSSHRRAMLRNLTANLVLHEGIVTTEAKAKELRRTSEKLLTKARRLGELAYSGAAQLAPEQAALRLHVKREIASVIPRFGVTIDSAGVSVKVDLVEKILLDLAKRFSGRNGGYTRIVKFGNRRGDNAPMCRIEFVEQPVDTAVVRARPETPESAVVA